MPYDAPPRLIPYQAEAVSQTIYFQITLEPHLKHSGLATGRKILFLAAVPVHAAKAASNAPDDDQVVCKTAERLAAALTGLAMTGKGHQPGEDEMRVSCQPISRMSNDLTERLPDAEKDGVRVWLVGARPV
jgi:hypothetical protein